MKKTRVFSRIFAEDLGNGHLQNRSGSEPQRNHKKGFGTKMKRLFSGLLAAFLCLIVVFVPLSTAIASEGEDENASDCTGKIIIHNPTKDGTYTAYPIFTGEVEWDDDSEKLLISNINFHNNLETKIEAVAASQTITERKNTDYYALWQYLSNDTYQIQNNGELLRFKDLVSKYDPNSTLKNLSFSTPNLTYTKQAEELAKILNLTSTNNKNVVNGLIDRTQVTSAFYPAFAEAARMCMLPDNTKIKSFTGTVDSTTNDYVIDKLPDGYYVVEWTPNNSDGNTDDKIPWGVRRSLVLVGQDSDHPAEIHSKDTENITNVDVKFYNKAADTSKIAGNETDGTLTFSEDAFSGGQWKKNVSMGNGAYVNCRIEVELPSNLSAYEQYYLAVPIMYNYNGEGNKSIRRINVAPKVYLYKQAEDGISEGTKVSEIKGKDTINSPIDSIKDADNFKYANGSITNSNEAGFKDEFTANETFVITDLLSLNVKNDEFSESTLKTLLDSGAANYKLVFEFPVQFQRDGYTTNFGGINAVGYNYNPGHAYNNFSDDYLLRNYITVRAVYSNNPNLKAKDTEATGEISGIDNLYVDTSEDPGSLHNPVSYTSQSASANIVTYRLRFHATKNDITDNSKGIGGVSFVLKNDTGSYAILKKSDDTITSYDTVSTDEFNSSGFVSVNLYQITGWKEISIDEIISDNEKASTMILSTYKIKSDSNAPYDASNSGRFEIIGLEPGNYTLIALDSRIEAYEGIGSTTKKGYKLKNTNFEFSFSPALKTECQKMDYDNHINPNKKNDIIENLNFIATNTYTSVGYNSNVALMSMQISYTEKGIPLPVTGGIGTFIFYAVGGVLVIISIVAIITKIRIKHEQL